MDQVVLSRTPRCFRTVLVPGGLSKLVLVRSNDQKPTKGASHDHANTGTTSQPPSQAAINGAPPQPGVHHRAGGISAAHRRGKFIAWLVVVTLLILVVGAGFTSGRPR